MTVRAKAFAKINWSLEVVGTYPDGYHALDMLMESVSLADDLTFSDAPELTLTVDGKRAGAENLVYRAARRLSPERGARIALQKHIPARAGLGGGSADCAAALIALNRLWDLRIAPAELARIGMELGADVPFCLTGGLCRVSGKGETVEPLPRAPEAKIAIAMRAPGLSTRDVFARFHADSANTGFGADDCFHSAKFISRADDVRAARLRGDYAALRALSRNDLRPCAAALEPAVEEIVAAMYDSGADFAQMSGSGSAVFGVFTRCDPPATRLRKRFGFCEICTSVAFETALSTKADVT